MFPQPFLVEGIKLLVEIVHVSCLRFKCWPDFLTFPTVLNVQVTSSSVFSLSFSRAQLKMELL